MMQKSIMLLKDRFAKILKKIWNFKEKLASFKHFKIEINKVIIKNVPLGRRIHHVTYQLPVILSENMVNLIKTSSVNSSILFYKNSDFWLASLFWNNEICLIKLF